MHTEPQIRAAIKPLIELYGELTTTEIKQRLEEVLDFDDEDKIPSETRNEILITQNIEKIITNQTEKIKIYPEGFIVDKNLEPAHFFAIKGKSKSVRKISKAEIKKRTEKTKIKRNYENLGWEHKNERETFVGCQGIHFVFLQEIKKIKNGNDKFRVQSLTPYQSKIFGYDIASIGKNGETIFIEVKTTKGNEITPFFMSDNEKLFFQENDNAYIYRVYNFNEDDRHGKVKIISSKELLTNYNFDPTYFFVTPKK